MNIHKAVKQAIRSVRVEQLSLIRRAQEENSYSAMMRKLRKEGDKEKLKQFQVSFKKNFEAAYCQDLEPMEQLALMAALKEIGE